MFVYRVFILVVMCGSLSSDPFDELDPLSSNFVKSFLTTVENHVRENSDKLTLDAFSFGIFSGAEGRLSSLTDFSLQNEHMKLASDRDTFSGLFRFRVPKLHAKWQKATCLSVQCAFYMDLDDAEFELKLSLDAVECIVTHWAQLSDYGEARCNAVYQETVTPMVQSPINLAIQLMSQLLNSVSFRGVVKDNVNYGLLRMPILNQTDIVQFCYMMRRHSIDLKNLNDKSILKN